MKHCKRAGVYSTHAAALTPSRHNLAALAEEDRGGLLSYTQMVCIQWTTVYSIFDPLGLCGQCNPEGHGTLSCLRCGEGGGMRPYSPEYRHVDP